LNIAGTRSRLADRVARAAALTGLAGSLLLAGGPALAQKSIAAAGSKLPQRPNITITAQDVTAGKVGTSIPVSAIGEPVSAVRLDPPKWTDSPNGGYASVDGQILPIDPNAPAINFQVMLPASWNRRAAQLGGGGWNGSIPRLNGAELNGGAMTYGSDSGHQARGGNGWTLNEEAVKNLAYMQMKKTHDAAMVIAERVYGERPRFNYYFGSSQGGREGLAVIQRYPKDYDGIAIHVPVVSLSSLALAPIAVRIQEKPLEYWVTPAKTNAIRAEFLRQTDKLDGIEDGIISNYMAARAIFDLSQGDPKRDPWKALRAPDGVDPDPADTSVNAKLTDGQIRTLEFSYSKYRYATPLADGVKSFGMWLPTIDPVGSNLIKNARYRGQEGAAENAQLYTHAGSPAFMGMVMGDLAANPLDYVEGGRWDRRRREISGWLDATDPDLSAFYQRGGKMLVTIGSQDMLASPGAQIDYYQSVLDKMGRRKVDAFARLIVKPQVGHGLSGRSADINGSGQGIPVTQIPSQWDEHGALFAWVERNEAPGKSVTVSAAGRGMPLCSYPEYPRYKGGDAASANSYACTSP
jgi:feruloyl esterase